MMPYVGQPIKRVEDLRLLRGEGAYVDDLRFGSVAHVAILRSPHAHARIRSLDCAAARKAPGVLAVVTGEDTHALPDLPAPDPLPANARIPRHPVLALDTVRFVGEPIAAVVAEDPYRARDALDLVDVRYESLASVTGIEAALAPDAPGVPLLGAHGVGSVAGMFFSIHVRSVTPRMYSVTM